MATAPTAAQILEWSNVDFAALGYPDAPSLGFVVDRANAALEQVSGQTWASMPANFVKLAEQAVQGLTEQLAYRSTEEYAETLSDWDLIQSFSAGGYSETRRSPDDMFKARLLNAWPWLSDLLWLMLSDDKRDYWLGFFGGSQPAFEVTEVDWAEEYGPYGDWGY